MEAVRIEEPQNSEQLYWAEVFRRFIKHGTERERIDGVTTQLESSLENPRSLAAVETAQDVKQTSKQTAPVTKLFSLS